MRGSAKERFDAISERFNGANYGDFTARSADDLSGVDLERDATWTAELTDPRGIEDEDEAADLGPDMRRRAHRAMLAARIERRPSALLEAEVFGRPARELDLGMRGDLAPRLDAVRVFAEALPAR